MIGKWQIPEYKLTATTILCNECGNQTLMKIISNGVYVRELFDEEFVPQTYNEIKVLVCSHCHELNIIQQTQWSESEPDYERIDSYGEEIYTLPLPQTKYWHLESFEKFGESGYGSDLAPIDNTYEEAKKCFLHELYSSTVINCRTVIELLCRAYGITEPTTLDGKLKEMMRQEIIDNMLFEWANTLKNFGNDAVHVNLPNKKFSKQDAKDILDLTYALLEYCLNFKVKLSTLKYRRGSKASKKEAAALQQSKVLDKLETESIVNTFVESLSGSNEVLCYYASAHLIELGEETDKAIDKLIDILTDKKKKKFHSGVLEYLVKAGEKAVQKVAGVLTNFDFDFDTRVEAAKILIEIGLEESTPELIKFLNELNLSEKHRNSVLGHFLKKHPKPETAMLELISLLKDNRLGEDLRLLIVEHLLKKEMFEKAQSVFITSYN